MRIIYCIPGCYNSGGMERVLSIKANYLTDVLGHEVIIITSSQKCRNNYYDFSSKIKFYDLGINYDDLICMSLFKKVFYTYKKKIRHKNKLQSLLYELKADIVVSMFTHEMSFLCGFNDGSKKILELHFSKNFRYYNDIYNNANYIKRLISSFLDYRDRKKISKYDKFIVLSEEDKEDWGLVENIQVIYNPMPFFPKKISDLESKQILAVGRLCKQKGFDVLIDIWNNIVKEKKDKGYYISIYGTGPEKEYLENKINNLGLSNKVFIKEPIKNIESVYYNSSIFCFPSRYEGFGMALAEAMSCGIASISFSCPCGPSDIIVNESNGILVDCFDKNKFQEKLLDLIEHPSKRKLLGMKAKESMEEKFAITKIMNEWNNLFYTIIEK